jgi:hypothetical protein
VVRKHALEVCVSDNFACMTFLDESLKGDTMTICSPENKKCSSIKKLKEPEDDNVQQLLAHGKEMLKIMTDAAIDCKQQIKLLFLTNKKD